MIWKLAAGATLVCLSACSTLYQPLKLDEKTGQYPTSVQVDPGGVTALDTSKDPRQYRHVLLLTDANVRPSVFAFTVRQALAQAGIVRVFTTDEFAALAADRGIAGADGQITNAQIQRFSKDVGSVLVIDYRYQFLGDARFLAQLSATDATTGAVLLRVNHPRLNWANADAEAMYPVLNELRKWIQLSAKGQA
jgi:hypothetical protein